MPAKDNPSHKKKPADQVITPDRKAELARQNGLKGGRPLGSTDSLPRGAIEALKTAKFRVKAEYKADPNACEVAGDALDVMVKVMHGRVHSRRAPSALKAATAVRHEICEPVQQEVKVSGTLGIASAMAEANKLINEKKET
jgi:hypothetical protein